MRELNKTARTLGKTAGTLNAPFAAAAKGFAIAAGAAVAVGGAMFAAARAAAEEDASIARLNAAISANTTITDEQTKQMDAAIEARQNLAFSDDALRDSLSRLIPRTGDVTKAIELQSIAMDFARLRGVDLSTASDLVGKVFSGNTSILSRYGFTVEKGATATEALAMIQEAAAGQAEAYGNTTQGALESIQIAIDNTVEDIGRVVLPILAEVLTTFRDEIMPRVKEFGIAFANAFTQAIDKLRPFITTMVTQVLPAIIAVGGAIIGTLVKAFTELGKFIGDNTGLVLALVGAYTAFTIAVNIAATATRLAATAMGIFNAIMSMNPIVLVVAAIAALAAGFIIAYNTIEPFRNLVNALFKAIQPLLAVVIDLALFIGTNIVRAFGLAVSVVSELAKVLWDDGNGPLAIAVNAIGKVFDAITAPIRFFIGLVESAISVVRTLINLANNLPFVGGFLPRGGAGGPARERRRALGGPVTGGQQYMVGERGPELFVPNQSGSIVPNNSLGGQINVTVQAGAFLGSSDDAREFARRIYGALNDEARRRGTVLGGAR
jgi:phage-related protein